MWPYLTHIILFWAPDNEVEIKQSTIDCSDLEEL